VSTSASQAALAPSWKEEVNRCLAAHNNHKGPSLAQPLRPVPSQHGANSAAAQAAARVAARFAKAPSYSDVLAEGARAAVRAASAASRAALDAQAAAESVLAGLEAAKTSPEIAWEPDAASGRTAEHAPAKRWESDDAPVQPATFPSSQTQERQSYEIRWEPDMPVRSEPTVTRASHGRDDIEAEEAYWRAEHAPQDAMGDDAFELVEPTQPIHANLIQFPREIVATHKARPRLAEGPQTETVQPETQLSIFEVDPGAVATQAVVEETAVEPPAPVWSGMELDDQPEEETEHEATTAAASVTLEQAPMNRRMLAFVVDGTLITGAFVAAAMTAVYNAKELPNPKVMELGAVVALVAACALYKMLFYTLAEATPGMKYAHISLCTFDDENPTRAQRCSRLGALLLSLLPVGLGVVWALFDDNHLSWHDHLSRTYLRMY
jgi:uncharacterized RDD family membrane protein YckC